MRKHRHVIEDETEVDMTPMLDIVFIMLIFFIVTTSFIKESGIEINRPESTDTPPPESSISPIAIRISDTDDVRIGTSLIEVAQVEARVSAALAKRPKAAVIVQAAEAAHTGIVVGVVDAVRKAGIERVTVLREKK